MLNLTHNYRLILASRSMRRRQLLYEAGLEFDVIDWDFDESYPESEGLSGKEIAEYLARSKATQLAEEFSNYNRVIITADTVVWCNGEVLGKPTNYESAFRILKTISANSHEVITGICLKRGSLLHVFSETTKVIFDELSDEMIDFYITNYHPFDKAGAYGIQEWIGLVGNAAIEGSYYNVMGLPVHRLLKELKKITENK
ncbi:MAG: Maf family nucleotide pyrophosphatase [Bacteroidales bacterium]